MNDLFPPTGNVQSLALNLTTIQVAKYLGVSPDTLGGWRYKGTGPKFTKTNGLVSYHRDDIEAWKAQHDPAPTPGNGDYHESYLIGALLKAPEKLDDVSIVELDDINNPNYRIYLDALRLLAQLRGSLTLNDLTAVVEMVARLTYQSEPDVVSMVTALTEPVYSTANLLNWAIKVKRASLNRLINHAMKSGDGRKVHDLIAEQDRLGERLKKPALKSRFVRLSAMGDRPPAVDWLIHDYLERDTTAQIFGNPGSAKSFVALDMALSIATGQDWCGHATKSAPVFYIAGEGLRGLQRRKEAWFKYHDIEDRSAPFWLSNGATALSDPGQLAALIADIDAAITDRGLPGVIAIDTVARNFGGGDENSTKDMSAFIAALDTLRERYHCCILLVHHTGHGDKTRARGSIALLGSLDAEYRVEKTDDVVQMVSTRQKDNDDPPALAWTLTRYNLPWADEYGQPLNSAVLVPNDSVPAAIPVKEKSLTGLPRQALDTLRGLYRQQWETLVEGKQDPNQARVTISQWNDAMQSLSGNKDYRSTVRRDLEKRGYVRFEAPYVCLTDLVE